MGLIVLGYLVEVLVDAVKTGSPGAVHVEPPVANPGELVEDGAVGAQEAVLLAVGQTPVPDLHNLNNVMRPTIHTRIAGCLHMHTSFTGIPRRLIIL